MSTPGPRGQLQRLWSAEGLALVVGVLQGLVLARTFGPALYGVYALAVTYAAFVFVVLDPRSGDVLVRYLVDFRRSDDRPRQLALVKAMLLIDVGLGAVGVAAIALTAPAASRLLSIDGYATLLVLASVGALSAAPIFSSRAILSVFERFDLISRRQTAAAVLRAAAVTFIAFSTPSLDVVLILLSLVSALEMTMFVVTALRVSHEAMGAAPLTAALSPLRDRRREIGRFMLSNGSGTLLASSIKQVDTLLVGAVAGPREAGLYRLAKSLTTPIGSAGIPIQTMLYPRLADAWGKGERDAFRYHANRVFWRTGLPLAAVILCTLPGIPMLIQLLAGDDYSDAALATQGFVVAAAFSLATVHQRPMLLSGGWLKPMLVMAAITSVISVAAAVPSAQLWGASGASWSRTLIVGLAALSMALFLARRSRSSPASRHQDR